MAANGESITILREIKEIMDRFSREAAEDRKQAERDRAKWEEVWAAYARDAAADRRQAAEDRRQAAEDRKRGDQDRKEFGRALLLLARVGKRIEEKLDLHTDLLREIRSILRVGRNGRARRGNGGSK